uniref:Cell death inducing DFFA like effector a n=1 Tax=Laticauda laticaudata TaxID=8630 RepID=A0A8C5WRW2_LATLA
NSILYFCFRSLVSVGTSVGSVTRQALLPCAPRPFRICNHDRSSRRGVVASSLQDLINKTLDALVITAGLITLVLEEDGTVVDTEDFFQSLGDNTQLMLLEKGQKWKPVSVCSKQPKKMGVANFTLDLYKLNPKDFIGCLNVKATFYEIYSVSYDIKCTGAKTTGSVECKERNGMRSQEESLKPQKKCNLKKNHWLIYFHTLVEQY